MAKTTKTYKWGLFSDYGMKILNETCGAFQLRRKELL